MDAVADITKDGEVFRARFGSGYANDPYKTIVQHAYPLNNDNKFVGLGHPRLGDEVMVLGDAAFFTLDLKPGEEIMDPEHVFANRDTADVVVVNPEVSSNARSS